MTTKHKIYALLSGGYFCLSVWYIGYLWQVDCDGLACTGILFFSMPLTILFSGCFLTMTCILFNYWIIDKNKADRVQEQLRRYAWVTLVPFWVFTALFVYVGMSYLF